MTAPTAQPLLIKGALKDILKWFVDTVIATRIDRLLELFGAALAEILNPIVKVLVTPALELMTHTPAPRFKAQPGGVLMSPTNAPWNQIYPGNQPWLVGAGMAILVVSYLGSTAMASWPGASERMANQREYGLFVGLVAIPASGPIIGLGLRFINLLVENVILGQGLNGGKLANAIVGANDAGGFLLIFLYLVGGGVYAVAVLMNIARIVFTYLLVFASPVLLGFWLSYFPGVWKTARQLLGYIPKLAMMPVVTAFGLRLNSIFLKPGNENAIVAGGIASEVAGSKLGELVLQRLFYFSPAVIGIVVPILLMRSMGGMPSVSARSLGGLTRDEGVETLKRAGKSAGSTAKTAGKKAGSTGKLAASAGAGKALDKIGKREPVENAFQSGKETVFSGKQTVKAGKERYGDATSSAKDRLEEASLSASGYSVDTLAEHLDAFAEADGPVDISEARFEETERESTEGEIPDVQKGKLVDPETGESVRYTAFLDEETESLTNGETYSLGDVNVGTYDFGESLAHDPDEGESGTYHRVTPTAQSTVETVDQPSEGTTAESDFDGQGSYDPRLTEATGAEGDKPALPGETPVEKTKQSSGSPSGSGDGDSDQVDEASTSGGQYTVATLSDRLDELAETGGSIDISAAEFRETELELNSHDESTPDFQKGKLVDPETGESVRYTAFLGEETEFLEHGSTYTLEDVGVGIYNFDNPHAHEPDEGESGTYCRVMPRTQSEIEAVDESSTDTGAQSIESQSASDSDPGASSGGGQSGSSVTEDGSKTAGSGGSTPVPDPSMPDRPPASGPSALDPPPAPDPEEWR